MCVKRFLDKHHGGPGVLTNMEVFCGPFTDLWKVLRSLNLRYFSTLEILVCFFVEVKIFRFWLKTMDYSQAF